ncbi:extracellular solute-binding protein [Saccharococcus caldoxylosilyticus]|uniref:extracellular solute-binding protein n=1 Tax=Saccharococcus caldoxylosilyticus TaxID=81408 RepID=UPI0005A71365|nr:extracellular solute-binding protein [Parageobacillus caldoxylosilyticus]MBB3853307.1 raffinose/stachyose/melibiose transport system substrate-binding protein [Parageobacillus caldoxylosilyticus]BDG43646.1 putative ABC transporter extracellular-binding protein YurO [Parageobacillus caldoxylosilyticus]
MSKKAYSLFCVMVIAFALVLTGCSSSTNGNPSSSESGKKVTITFMHLWPAGSSKQQNMIVNEIIKEFEKQNPNVTVKQEVLENEQYKNKLKILASSNELPDVGMTWAAGFLEPYVKGNLFAPLDDILNSGLKDKFVSGTTEAYAVNNKTYALPLELNITPIYYNKKIFSKYHLEPPQTYEDFKNIVQTLVKNGVAPIALGNKDRWTGSLWYMYLADRIGGADTLKNAINRKGSFEDPSLIKAAEEVQKLVKMKAFIKGFNGLSNDEAKSEFMNEKAAMYLMGTWELPNFTTNEEVPKEFRDKVGFFKFPVVDGGKGDVNSWVGGPGVGLFVSENSKVKKEAKEFVKFFIEKWGEQSVTKAGVIPATKVDTANIHLPQLYIDVLSELNKASNITLFADVQMNPEAAQTHLNLIQSLFGEEVTPKDFVKQHEEVLAKTQ